MSIATRINEIEEHLEDDYKMLSVAGADLTSINKNILNLKSTWKERLLYFMENGTNVIWENWDKVVGEGTSLSLNNTLEAKMKIELKGNTYQNSTTGKNLFNPSNFTPKGNVSITSDGVISSTAGSSDVWSYANSQYKDTLQAGTYTLKVYFDTKETISWGGIAIYNSNNQSLYNNYNIANVEYITKTFTINQTTNIGIMFKLKDGVCRCQLEKSSSATPYEPYTGGIPSPNPDYPQDIQVVSGDNSIEVCGKNKLPPTSDFETTRNSVTFKGNNGIYTIEGTATSGSASTSKILLTKEYTIKSGDYLHIGNTSISANTSMTYYFTDNTSEYKTLNTTNRIVDLSNHVGKKINGIAFWVANNSQVDLTIMPMILNTSTATTYEPYASQSYPIYLPVENLIPTQTNAWEQGTISSTTGQNSSSTTRLRTIDYYPIENDKNYKVSVQDTNYCYVNILLYDENKTYIGNYSSQYPAITGATNLTINIDSTHWQNVAYMRIIIKATNDSTITASAITTIKPQIEKGSKRNSFTPYGTTPIELCKIGEYQDSIKKSTGKNLFDIESIIQSERINVEDGELISNAAYETSDYIKVDSNTSYTISWVSDGDRRIVIDVGYYDENKNYLGYIRQSLSAIDNYTFTTLTNTKYIRYSYLVVVSNVHVDRNNMQLEKGTSSSPYEPYGKVWCKYKQIGKIVLDGSESWTKYGTYGNGYLFYLDNVIFGLISSTYPFGNGLSDKFIWTQDSTTSAVAPYIRFNGSGNRLYMAMTSDMTLEEFKTWLSTHNTEIYYILATPTSEEITNATLINQLNNLANANSYDTQTNISQTNNDLASILNATALENM